MIERENERSTCKGKWEKMVERGRRGKSMKKAGKGERRIRATLGTPLKTRWAAGKEVRKGVDESRL